uniref:Ig-like domain-containing protein n=1 Tax=Eptatretus burgeri TaxID=7764 RepID=A0A8C4R851_EPTBU
MHSCNFNAFHLNVYTYISERVTPPKFIWQPPPVHITAGEPTELECHVTGSSSIKVTWAKGARDIRPVGNFRMKFVDNRCFLTILKAEKVDAGVYSCKATNEAGTDTCNIEVIIKDRPIAPTFEQKLKPIAGVLNTLVVLKCKLSGSEPMDISWYKDEMEVFDGDRFKLRFGDMTARLEIGQLNAFDRANYTCKAINSSGSAASTASLSIIGQWM